MQYSSKYTYVITLLLLFFAISSLGPQTALGVDYCGDDIGTPPFLSGGVDPNLLL